MEHGDRFERLFNVCTFILKLSLLFSVFNDLFCLSVNQRVFYGMGHDNVLSVGCEYFSSVYFLFTLVVIRICWFLYIVINVVVGYFYYYYNYEFMINTVLTLQLFCFTVSCFREVIFDNYKEWYQRSQHLLSVIYMNKA